MPAIMHLMPPPPTLSMVSTLQSAMSAALCTNLFCSESRLAQALIHNIITIIRNICSKEAEFMLAQNSYVCWLLPPGGDDQLHPPVPPLHLVAVGGEAVHLLPGDPHQPPAPADQPRLQPGPLTGLHRLAAEDGQARGQAQDYIGVVDRAPWTCF